MAQKDKVKELVGRGLDSYHTKSLQQIDRINKKNKEQNHKISILTNELDNDYLTKTEEGSVISLEHSKEGMVYLDELQGNTLVNYCTDGSKELTLNGDIDVEGTFVTTTEGVDNGKVDVMCEGNTLVNLYDWNSLVQNGTKLIKYNRGFKYVVDEPKTNEWIYQSFTKPPYKDNTTYTFIINITKNTFPNKNILRLFRPESTNGSGYWIAGGSTGILKCVITTNSTKASDWNGVNTNFGFALSDVGELIVEDIILLEGDWTNKEIPQHFTGMKSVGQDDENGHKIEILSKNKNLFNPEEVYESGYSYGVPFVNSVKYQEEDGVFTTVTPENSWNRGIGFHVKTEKNKDYTLSVGEYFNDGTNMDLRCVGVYKSEYPLKNNNNIQSYVDRIVAKDLNSNNNSLTYNSKDYDYILFYIGGKWNENANGVKTFRMSKIEVNQSSTKPTNYTKQNLNKKEISLNEPLRATENYKDKLVKINGKWFIERNCGVEVLDGTNPYGYAFQSNEQSIKAFVVNGFTKRKRSEPFVIENYPYIDSSTWSARTSIGLYNGTGDPCGLVINESELTSLNDAGVKEYLSRKPIRFVYAKDVPTYEEITDSTLTTYLDITHISNNSAIPCNMKIQNSGYNAIIKPSTQYTVVLDTNKSGTIGMNLGGAKVTTTNNVATITTPATLSDDSLRLYGKGIKGSKVRLLEGDKTNWIPSFFEGMKSSFEDKVQEDGTYKMEILSNNENLFSLDKCKIINISNAHELQKGKNGFILKSKQDNSGWIYSTLDISFKLKPSTKYTLSHKISKSNKNTKPCFRILDLNNMKDYALTYNSGKYEFTTPNMNTQNLRILLYSSIDNVPSSMGDTFEFNDIKISEVKDGVFKENKHNKIQFSSIEPLRGVGDVKDRFVFKDEKLMIERNCCEGVLNGNEEFSEGYSGWNNKVFGVKLTPNGKESNPDYITCLSDNLPTRSINSLVFVKSNKGVAIWNFNGNKAFVNVGKDTKQETIEYLKINPIRFIYQLKEPTYEEIPHELQRIILEGYENGTLFFDTNIPPTVTTTYAGETPIVKATKSNRVEVASNTTDINDNIIPYLCDMDYRIVTLELQQQLPIQTGMFKLFGGVYEMLKRDILSKRLSKSEYQYRLTDYFTVGKLTEQQVRELEDLINE